MIGFRAVSTHSRLKAAGSGKGIIHQAMEVSTHSRLKAAGRTLDYVRRAVKVSTHSRLKAAGTQQRLQRQNIRVSTHSRLKAAGFGRGGYAALAFCFNTQPPEGGWAHKRGIIINRVIVSTHSRLKAAGFQPQTTYYQAVGVSTHSRLKAAGQPCHFTEISEKVSTHSRLKAAGASLKSLAPSGFAALISLSSQEKREREYNTAFSVIPAFAIS